MIDGADGDHVARQRLAPVGDALVDGRHAALRVFQVLRRHAHRGGEVPGRLVELADVPHDVHVAHVIAVPLVHGAAVGDQYLFMRRSYYARSMRRTRRHGTAARTNYWRPAGRCRRPGEKIFPRKGWCSIRN